MREGLETARDHALSGGDHDGMTAERHRHRQEVAEAYRRGAMAALGCDRWDDADDFFALVGMGYAGGNPDPPTMPKPRNQWRCMEEAPKGEDVLVTSERHDGLVVSVARMSPDHDGWTGWFGVSDGQVVSDGWGRVALDPICWMPVPKPAEFPPSSEEPTPSQVPGRS